MILLGIITNKLNKNSSAESTFHVVHSKIYITRRTRIREVFLLKCDGNLEPNFKPLDGRFKMAWPITIPVSKVILTKYFAITNKNRYQIYFRFYRKFYQWNKIDRYVLRFNESTDKNRFSWSEKDKLSWKIVIVAI